MKTTFATKFYTSKRVRLAKALRLISGLAALPVLLPAAVGALFGALDGASTPGVKGKGIVVMSVLAGVIGVVGAYAIAAHFGMAAIAVNAICVAAVGTSGLALSYTALNTFKAAFYLTDKRAVDNYALRANALNQQGFSINTNDLVAMVGSIEIGKATPEQKELTKTFNDVCLEMERKGDLAYTPAQKAGTSTQINTYLAGLKN